MSPASKTLVRPATEADSSAIHRVTRAAFEVYGNDVRMPAAIIALRETEEDVRRMIRHAGSGVRVLVAEVEGVVVGSVRYQDIGGIGYLSRFAVRPDLQRGGIGRVLVQAVEDGCRAMGLPAIALHTSSRMSSLVHFYYRAGYFIHSTSTERGYIRALFVKELGEPDAYDLSPASRY